jgi:NAD(P)-dependent dehydrogenase (short-subunit alcohol dehydrogenase family)
MDVLKNKVAIITGASSGIGYEAAKLFAQEGANVVVAGRRRAELDALVGEIEKAGGKAIAVAGDVKDEAHAKALVDTAVNQFGGLDIAFNNAGSSGEMAPVPELSLAGWRDTIDTNLTSAFLGAKYQVPAMINRGGGSIVFTSSFVGHTVGFPGTGAYAAAKAGIVGLTQVLAAEFGAKGIRANAILPGGTDTPANHANLPGAPEGTRTFIEGLHALKRLARPEEIARSALHLASDASSFITGVALLVDGGVSINRT